MRTKKTTVEKFTEKVDALSAKLLDDKQGYVLFCFNEMEDKAMQSYFSSKGNISNIVECMYASMKSNPMLANMMMAACNAVTQVRMQEMAAQAEENTNEETTTEE